MRERLLYQFLLEADNEAGRMRALLHIKQSGKNMADGRHVRAGSIFHALLKVAGGILLKLVYVLMFMYIPYRILSVVSVWAGFQLRQSIVYFTCLLSCVCGSLVNSYMFDVDEDAHALLSSIQVEPALLFKERLVYRLFIDGAGFLLAYSIIGLDFGHAFYLMVWVLISRLVGELVNLYVFRYTGRIINEIPVVTIVIMATCLFLSYGFPFLRNRVVDLTIYIYDYIWLLAALIVAAVALYVLFSYDGYAYIAGKYIERMKQKGYSSAENGGDFAGLPLGGSSQSGYFREYDKDRTSGLEYLHKILFLRNLDYVRSIMTVRVMFIVVAAVVGVVLCKMSPGGTRDIIWSVLCEALPVMVFIMYCLSVTPKLCKSMFYYIDCSMLQSKAYREKSFNFKNFIVRLRILVLCELSQALVMCIAFIVVAAASGNAGRIASIIPVCAGIILLSVFYAVFNLLVYYMCQPYTQELKARGYTFFAAHAGMLAICYGCVYISCNAFVFDMVLALTLAVMLSLSSTLVYWFSDRTFGIR